MSFRFTAPIPLAGKKAPWKVLVGFEGDVHGPKKDAEVSKFDVSFYGYLVVMQRNATNVES